MLGAVTTTPKTAFEAAPWATAATVIPVLMLALIFNEKYFDHSENESPRGSIFLLSIAVSMVVGEVLAMSTLWEAKEPGAAREAAVLLGVAMPLLALTIRMVEPRLHLLGEVMSKRAIAVWTLIGMASVLAFAVCTMLGVNTDEWPAYGALGLFVFATFVGANPNRRDDKGLASPDAIGTQAKDPDGSSTRTEPM